LKECDGVPNIFEIHREWLLPSETSSIASQNPFGDCRSAYATDEAILQRTDTIAWMLLQQAGTAFIARDEACLARYRWFTNLVNDLLEDVPDKLNG